MYSSRTCALHSATEHSKRLHKILVLTQSFLGGTVLGLANYLLMWIRKTSVSVQTPDTVFDHTDVFIWISNSFLHFKQRGAYVSDKKAENNLHHEEQLEMCLGEKPCGKKSEFAFLWAALELRWCSLDQLTSLGLTGWKLAYVFYIQIQV